MADPRVLDLRAVERDVARGWDALQRWRRGLAAGVAVDADPQPLESLRWVAGRSTWAALGELQPAAVDVPTRESLRAWVIVLTMARVLAPDDVAIARAQSAPLGLYAGEVERLVSWREAWRETTGARSALAVRRWLDAAAEAGPQVASANAARAARQVEVARRFNLPHPWGAFLAVPAPALEEAAARFLEATQELSRSLRRDGDGQWAGPSSWIHAAVARDAGEGWPARLSARWLEDTFGAVARSMPVELPALPASRGGSSFMRAMYAFGFGLQVGGSRPLPFAIGREPSFRAAHRLGFVFAALAVDPEWQTRALGLARRAALTQSRLLCRTALLDARLHAARILLGDPAQLAPHDRFDEIGDRLFGAPLDARLRGAWPAARDDEPGRFVALLEARSAGDDLRNRFDADWFRNPRAWEQLRAASAAPAREPVDASSLASHASALAAAFEAALG